MNKLNNQQLNYIIHPFLPVFDSNSKILILGSMPSVRSRETNFYYGHPRNRFWKIITYITKLDHEPGSIEEKKGILLANNIALWDVIESCKIYGSSDSSITDVKVNNIRSIVVNSNIKRLYANGNLAHSLYMKYCFPDIGIKTTKLPSTSPANASYSLQRLLEYWSVIVC